MAEKNVVDLRRRRHELLSDRVGSKKSKGEQVHERDVSPEDAEPHGHRSGERRRVRTPPRYRRNVEVFYPIRPFAGGAGGE